MAETGKAPPGQLLKILAKAVPELFRAAPLEASLLSLTLIMQAFVPILTLYLTRLTVDGVTALAQDEEIAVATLVAWWTLTLLLDVVLAPVSQVLQGNVAERFTARVNVALMDKAESLPGLELLEDKRFYDDLDMLQKGASNRPLNVLVMLVFTGQGLVTLVGLSGLLVSIGWWVPLAALAGAYPLAWASFRARERSFDMVLKQTPEARTMAYEANVALSHEFAAEVRLYGLLPRLRARYLGAFDVSHAAMRQTRLQEALRTTPAGILSLLVMAGLFAWSIYRAAARQLSAGEVVVVVGGLTRLQGGVSNLIGNSSWLLDRVLYFEKYFDFLAAEPQVKNPERPVSLPAKTPHIRFEHVSFHYPDGRAALHDVSFELRPGETVAVVGENGAGKTTLVKLLLRFYDPTEGAVTLGGVNLREVDLNAWRRRVSAVFQDFGRYAYTVLENVELADVEAGDEVRATAALTKSGFLTSAGNLPGGLQTRLGKAFGGTELSGGQWQKLALARALYRDADVLVLDEPTAALDPRAEAALYTQFVALTEGNTALLITHRLGSVLMADRVLVLKAGRLVEEGTHMELLSRGGEYAELWALQAAQYREARAT